MSTSVRVLFLVFLVAVLALSAQPVCAGVPLLLNEVMASNSRLSKDPQGHFEDWVELYNTGSVPFNAAGLYLTDNVATPIRWRIPADRPALTTIAPHGYLLIWADSDTDSPGLHAGFRLSADGGQLALFGTDGQTLIDSVEFGEQRANVSYGRDPDVGDEWRFFAAATPGSANVGAYLGAVADLQFSNERGFYAQPLAVTITTDTPGASIFYTLDGSSPFDSQRRVTTGRLYTGPVAITTTTCLRALATKDGWMPSETMTHTYLFLDDVIRQATDPATGAQVVPPGYPATWPGGSYSGAVTGDYQMDPDVVGPNGRDKFGGLYAKTIKEDLKAVPTISVVMSRDDWFGPAGIYINESLDGQERICSVEWINPDGSAGFQINCAIAMQGGISGGGTSLDRWKTFKLSMRPRFKTTTDDGRSTEGPSHLHYRIFPDSPVEDFDTVVFDEVLSNAFNHSGQHMYPTYLQDQFVSDLHNAMGGQSPHGRYAHLYINGLYWGMYYVHERPDHAWAAQMFGGEKEEYDALKHNSGTNVNSARGGNATANFNAMLSAANAVAADPANSAKYQALCRMLDIDNFITDLLAHWFGVNWDWPEKNWYATHRSPDGLWRFHTWDAEHSLEYWNSQNVLGMSVAGLHDKLKGNADYRMHFADVVYRNFFNDGPLSLPVVTDMYRARMAQIDRAIVGESARWGDARRAAPHTRQDWVTIQDGILSKFLQPRPAFVLNWLKGAGLYPSVDAPEFRVNGQPPHGGHVGTRDSLSMTAAGTIWYTLDGTDPRVPGTPARTSATTAVTLVPESAAKRVLVPTGPIGDTWRTDPAFNDTSWLSGTGGVGYERSTGYETLFKIDVRSRMDGKNTTCYIRIPFNLTAEALAGLTSLTLKVRYDDGFIAYLNGAEIQRALFTGTPAWNSAASADHPDAQAVNWETFDVSGRLSSLRAGVNLLAIQALNGDASSSDFLLSVELSGAKSATGSTTPAASGVAPTAVQYATPFLLPKSATVKARALSGGTWSALNEAVFAVGPVTESLRVGEIMYHPPDSGNSSDPNTEFIELTNIANQSINLSLVRFTDGIEYAFPSFELPAGGYCLVVKDLAAFQGKYGSNLPVVGEYTGSLDNGGERIELVDAVGQVIQSFTYDDSWFKNTDGSGYSLVVRNVKASNPDSLNDEEAWRPSTTVGGSPGRGE